MSSKENVGTCRGVNSMEFRSKHNQLVGRGTAGEEGELYPDEQRDPKIGGKERGGSVIHPHRPCALGAHYRNHSYFSVKLNETTYDIKIKISKEM